MAKKIAGRTSQSRVRSTSAAPVGVTRTGSARGRVIGGYGGRTESGARGGMTDAALSGNSRAVGRSAPGTGGSGTGSSGGVSGGGSVTETTTAPGGTVISSGPLGQPTPTTVRPTTTTSGSTATRTTSVRPTTTTTAAKTSTASSTPTKKAAPSPTKALSKGAPRKSTARHAPPPPKKKTATKALSKGAPRKSTARKAAPPKPAPKKIARNRAVAS